MSNATNRENFDGPMYGGMMLGLMMGLTLGVADADWAQQAATELGEVYEASAGAAAERPGTAEDMKLNFWSIAQKIIGLSQAPAGEILPPEI
jgi:hypothetical protein